LAFFGLRIFSKKLFHGPLKEKNLNDHRPDKNCFASHSAALSDTFSTKLILSFARYGCFCVRSTFHVSYS
jgi:hypothetical protein